MINSNGLVAILCLSAGFCHARAAEPPTLESAAERAALPKIKILPAARDSELTPAIASDYSQRTWPRSNADSANTRYSSLSQIHRGNVHELQMAWTYRSGDGKGNVQANPVIVDGVMYAPTAGKNIVAIDAATGAEIWRFTLPPEVAASSYYDPMQRAWIDLPAGVGHGPAQRGLTYWAAARPLGPRLFFMANGYLIALDPRTGKMLETFGDRGKVAASKGAGSSTFLAAVAPAIYEDVIVAPTQNWVEAFDVVTGAPRWRFNTIRYSVADPNIDNGGNVWGGIALDTARGIVFVATGDPHPNFVGIDRPGSNEHTNSVIALDARTGQLRWAFQDVAHDLWDIDLPAAPVLVTILRHGRRIDAVAQVTKQSNTLLLDRLTGKPVFPFRLRRAPVSKLPGERTSPYQPALELPEPFARQEFGLNDITRLTPTAHMHVLAQVKNANFGWFAPFEEGKPTVIYPGTWGGAEWSGAAFNPLTGVLYVSSNESPNIVTVSRVEAATPAATTELGAAGAQIFEQRCAMCHGSRGEGKGMAPPLVNIRKRLTSSAIGSIVMNGKGAMLPVPLDEPQRQVLLAFLSSAGMSARNGTPDATLSFAADGFAQLRDDRGYPGVKPPWGTLNAIDLNTGRIVWRAPLGEHEELTREGVPKTGTLNYGGAMVTASGLVFCAGTLDGKIRAFDQTTGAELWAFRLPFGGYAPPATYEVDGRQHIVIAATGGGKLGGPLGDAYVAFALPRQRSEK